MNSFSFRKKPPKTQVDYKARLEYKLYLAREDPEPVFDLSECNLKTVPSGVYSLCKVFRKERLLLQVNQLTGLTGGGQMSDLALLTVLDLHNNRISSLPEDIRHLTNLLELNISSNELKKLPESLGSLSQLQELNCSENKLVSLPASLAQLSCLSRLDLRGNPLVSLPPCLASLGVLQQLLVNPQNLNDPPADVASKGTVAMLEFLSRKNGTEFKSWKLSVAEEEPLKSRNTAQITESASLVQDSFKWLGKKKEEKLQELLEVERNLQEQKCKEFEMHESMKQDKTKLLKSLKDQQRKLEEEVARFQTQKEQERGKLLNHLLKVECQAGEAVADLLAVNQALRLSSQWQEQETRDQDLLADYKTRTVQLRRQEVIDAMESLLAEERSRKEKLLAYEKNRSEAIQNSLLREVEWGGQVGALLSAREGVQAALVSAVEADTEMQKALVADMLERSDLRARGLVLQVTMVEQQLAVLTAVELQRRNVNSEQHLNDLAEKRKTLSDLLVGLLQEQRERHRQLVNALQQLDSDSQMCGNSPDYWLRQYQRLLDVRPRQLVPDLDPALIHQLVSSGVAHCLPFLSCCDIHSLSHSQLTQIGVTNLEDQNAIMQAVQTYLTHNAAPFLPSAPPPQHEASAPPLPSPTRQPLSECVVCMEAECAIVFVPCGHLCTCAGCAIRLLFCPLCRAGLDRKIHIILP